MTDLHPPESVGADPAEGDAEMFVEVEAYAGGGSRRVDLREPAPFGWTTAGLLGVTAMVEKADSAMVGAVLPSLQEYFGFGELTAGVLHATPSVAALLLVVTAGRLADTRTRKLVLAIVIASWGLLTFGAAAAPTFALFFVARVLLGVAAPLNGPAAASIIGDLYPSRARTRAFARYRLLEYLGFPIGVILGGQLADAFGWRAAFLVMGVPAVVLALIVLVWLREPRRGLADELTVEAERRGIVVNVAAEAAGVDPSEHVPAGGDESEAVAGDAVRGLRGVFSAIRDTMQIKTVRWIIIGQALHFAGAAGLFSYATTYFYRVHRDGGIDEGAAAGIAGGVGLVGLLLGGVLAGRVADRFHGTRPGWRVTVAASTFAVGALAVPVFAFVPVLPLQITLFLLINLVNIIALSCLSAATADVLPSSRRGTGFAALQFLVTIGSALGALVVGAVSAVVLGGRTDLSQGDINRARAEDAPPEVVASLEQEFWRAQEAGIQWGVGALTLFFVVGGLVVYRARRTYEADARRALVG